MKALFLIVTLCALIFAGCHSRHHDNNSTQTIIIEHTPPGGNDDPGKKDKKCKKHHIHDNCDNGNHNGEDHD